MQPLEQRSQFPAIGGREDEIKTWRQWLEATVSVNPILRPALYLHDESKIKLLSENFHNQRLMRALYAHSINEQDINLIESVPGLMALRVIGIRGLVDHGSPSSLEWQNVLSNFVNNEGYVPYPGFLSHDLLERIKRERLNRGPSVFNTRGVQHSRLVGDLEMKIIGVCPQDDRGNEYAVLTLINQTKPSSRGEDEMLVLSSKIYNIPQKPWRGYLLIAERNILRSDVNKFEGRPFMQFAGNPTRQFDYLDYNFLEFVITE